MSANPRAPEALAAAKKELRGFAQARREAMGEAERLGASQAIARALESFSAFGAAKVVLAFMAMRGEVDLRPLIERHPEKEWGIPRIVRAPAPHLEFHTYDAQRLVAHAYGMLEPAESQARIEPGEADLVLVPGLAFSPAGHRLGYGGGYYDRYLPTAERAVRVGIAYRLQVVDGIPHHAADQKVHYLATEDGLWPCAAALREEKGA
ncbi:MAG: 5-formyltetrahydrofolate cyclo-ligase [Chloroflexi bacterium]|nr:5-formyltetrahydrofolate cyclo-ligase [Chloroflexota bacterium]